MGVKDFLQRVLNNAIGGSIEPRSGLWENAEVVGESFYKDAFKILRSDFGAKVNDSFTTQVLLKQDAANPYSRSGKAVSVSVRGHLVGHISSSVEVAVFEALAKSGGSLSVRGRIYFGDLRATISKNSVTVDFWVQTKTSEEVEKSEQQYNKNQENRLTAEMRLREFLRNPIWSNHTLQAGDVVVFSGFGPESRTILEELASKQFKGEEREGSKVKLLVLHPSIISTSAKLRDALRSNKTQVTDWSTFKAHNPTFQIELPDS